MILSFEIVITGQVGVKPALGFLNCTNSLSEVTAEGFINPKVLAVSVSPDDFVLVKHSEGAGLFKVGISGQNVITLSPAAPNVDVPTTLNYMATYSDTNGSLQNGSTDGAINPGNIQAGKSGTAGTLRSYASTATTGYTELKHTANSGDYKIVRTNAAMGQDTTITTPDPGAESAADVIATGSLTTGHLLATSGIAGKVVDFGVAGTAATKAASDNAQATLSSVVTTPTPGVGAVATFTATNGSIGYTTGYFRAQNVVDAGAAATIVLTDANVTSDMVVSASFKAQTTPSVIHTVTAGNGDITIVCDVKPDACTIGYQACKAQ